jgi:hypothetical protein
LLFYEERSRALAVIPLVTASMGSITKTRTSRCRTRATYMWEGRKGARSYSLALRDRSGVSSLTNES